MADASNCWSEDRVERLKKLWSDGLSASQIAAELGGVTRNAVIGKVHRLGLSGRVKPTASSTPRVRKTPARPPSHPMSHGAAVRGNTALAPIADMMPDLDVAPAPAPRDDVVVPLSERVTIMELRDSMCRWPMGDPTTPEFRYCGAKSCSGMPYCQYHARIAYQPASERRRTSGERQLAAVG